MSSFNRSGFIFNDVYSFVVPDSRWNRSLNINPAHHEVVLLHVMDDAELNFPFQEVSEFVALEDAQSLLTSPGAIRKNYMDAVNEYTSYCKKQCLTHGVDYCLLNTAEPLDKALSSYLTRRSKSF